MAGPNMSRDESLAGKSVKQGGYTVTYDANGYAKSATKDGGKSANYSKPVSNNNGNNPQTVQTTNNWSKQAVNDQGYRDGVDYSLAIRNATSDAEIKQLQEERQKKIDAVYGGVDPYNNKTANTTTGKTTSGVSTASKYGQDWNPQTTTYEEAQKYAAVQTNVNAARYEAQQAAERGDWDAVGVALNKIAAAEGPDANGEYSMKNANAYGNELADYYGYDPVAYYNARYDEAYGAGSAAVFDATGGKVKSYSELVNLVGEKTAANLIAGYGAPTQTEIPLATTTPIGGMSAADLTQKGQYGGGTGPNGLNGAGVSDIYTPGSFGSYLQQWFEKAQQQQTNQIDYATQQGVNELIRAQQAADAQYQEQRDQIAIDEAKAKDNQALYAERRGDKGGIGAAQYDAIMNTAAQNRLQVNSAQQKLSTDTARQIADLRAQGEFEKADALLELTQQYLSQLMSLEQWSMEFGLSVAQFNASLQQWQAEYDMAVADLTGYYNGTPTLAYQKTLADQGWTMLAAGMAPSASQLSAMGLTGEQAQSYITAQKLAAQQKGSGGGGNGSGGGGDGDLDIDGLFAAALEKGGYSWLKQKSNYKKFGLDSAPSESDYKAWVEGNTYDPDDISDIAKGWYTDLYKMYGSQEDRLNAIYKEYNDGNSWMTNEDRLWLLDQFQLR